MLYAIGDIHGCFDKLTRLLDKIDIDFAQDTLIFVGDYIDRGHASFEVVEYLINLKKQYPGIIFLKGNHEEMLEQHLKEQNSHIYLANGGRQTIESYMEHHHGVKKPVFPEEHLAFFKSLRLFFQTDDYIFVHAGMKDKIPLEAQTSNDLLWIRHRFIRSTYDFGKRIVFGHTPLKKPLVEPNKIGIDTGAVYHNKLTCVKLPELIFFDA